VADELSAAWKLSAVAPHLAPGLRDLRLVSSDENSIDHSAAAPSGYL